MDYNDPNSPYWRAGYNTGFAGNAYGPQLGGARNYQQVAAYQRGYNAGWEDRIAAVGGGSRLNTR